MAGEPWRLQLRFRREYKPYSVTLDDVRRVDYSASDTPRDYSSFVTFNDPATGAEQPGRIWMNNPVRYKGETFYQSQYSQVQLPDGQVGEMTGLQVVENAGWLIPYVACVLAFWGMLAHFGGTFVRFADRHERERANGAEEHGDEQLPSRRRRGEKAAERRAGQRGWVAPVLALSLVGLIVLPAARGRRPASDAADWQAAGRLPVMHEGRIKPLDTVARNTLQLLSNRTTVKMPEAGEGPKGTVSATEWLLAVMANADWVADAPVFRVDAFELLDLFDLTRRPGHRYTFNELQGGREALQEQIATARDVPPEQRTFFQKKCGEINSKLMAYDLVRFAYDAPVPPQLAGDDETARQAAIEQMRLMIQRTRAIDENHPPAMIPPVKQAAADEQAGPAAQWQPLYSAVSTALVARMFEGRDGQPAYQPNPALLPFMELQAAVDGPPATINFNR